MSNTYYNPIPPRIWSRVQNNCTYTLDSSYNSIYQPLTNNSSYPTEAYYKDKQLYKGNILQYRNNSSNLTKKQKYSLISKGLWCNRTKVFATQSQTYSNPNTIGLQRINSTPISFPNEIVGLPNNISGPFQYGLPNPNNCPTTTIQDGGTLVGNTIANPCTGEVIKIFYTQQCFPTYCSDVPGPIIDLCWNPKVQTWTPKTRYTMSNSGTKWPQGYKGFISAAKPMPPILILKSFTNLSVVLSWTAINNVCIPISSYNIYQNDKLVKNVSYTENTTTIDFASGVYTFYIKSLSSTIESESSNIVTNN
uniref:Uncharacterized protein n=1 Tax=viral metagenome TaxID=1070528 RepID=A0A6C0IH67_9ZZZZ